MIRIELKHAKPCKLTMVTYNVNQALNILQLIIHIRKMRKQRLSSINNKQIACPNCVLKMKSVG